jgi:hypothetical protein
MFRKITRILKDENVYKISAPKLYRNVWECTRQYEENTETDLYKTREWQCAGSCEHNPKPLSSTKGALTNHEPTPHGSNHVLIMVKFWVSRSLEQNINWTTTSQNRTLPSTGRLQSVSLGNKTSQSNQTRPCNYAERIKPHQLNAGEKEPTKYPQGTTCTSNFMDKMNVIQFVNNDMPIVRQPPGGPRSNCKPQICHRYPEPLITKISRRRPFS